MPYEFYINDKKRIIVTRENICCEIFSQSPTAVKNWLKCDVKPETVLYFVARGLNELGMTSRNARIDIKEPKYDDFSGTPEEKAILYATEKRNWDYYVKDFYNAGIVTKHKKFFLQL